MLIHHESLVTIPSLKELHWRNKLRILIETAGESDVTPELFTEISYAVEGKPRLFRWRLRTTAAKLLGELHLTPDQQTAATELLANNAKASKLAAQTMRRFVVLYIIIGILLGGIMALSIDPSVNTTALDAIVRVLISALLMPAGTMLLVGPIFYMVERDNWDALREAIWQSMAKISRPEALPPILAACFQYGVKSNAAAVNSAVSVVESMTNRSLEEVQLDDLTPIYKLIDNYPQKSIVWLRILSVHGKGSSLVRVIQLIADNQGGGITEKAREVAELLATRLANETAKATYLRGSAASQPNQDSLLRPTLGDGTPQDNLLIIPLDV